MTPLPPSWRISCVLERVTDEAMTRNWEWPDGRESGETGRQGPFSQVASAMCIWAHGVSVLFGVAKVVEV